MRTNLSAGQENLPGLTSVRFFVALWVVLFHIAQQWRGFGPLHPLIDAGYSGVSFFFVLSGFILAYNYIPRGISPTKFWSARAARIIPVYWLGLVLTAPYVFHHISGIGSPLLLKALPVPLFLQAWLPATAVFWNGPGWSLSCEAFFYFLFPFVANPLVRAFKRVPALTFAILWIAGSVPSLWYAFTQPEGLVNPTRSATLLDIVKFNPIVRLPEFLLGIGLGVLYLNGARLKRPRLVVAGVVLAIYLCCSLHLPYPAIHNALLSPLYCLFILALASDTNLFAGPKLNLLGEASYSLYILHVPVLAICTSIAKRTGIAENGTFFFVYALVAISLSVVTFKHVEVPARVYIRSRIASKRVNASASLATEKQCVG